MSRRRVLLAEAALVLVAAACAIAIALALTPDQTVSTAGQTVQVGVTGPSLSFSGPGELELFGQHIPTTTTFAGPVRPKLRLAHITLSQQLAEFTQSGAGEKSARSLQDALVRGFWHYFYWEIAVSGVAAILLMGALCGWLRRGWKHTVVLIGVGLLVTEAINLGAIMFTAYSAPGKLSKIHSLQELVGSAPRLPPPSSTALKTTGRKVVVLGDSTAAGLGNPPLPHPSAVDKACERSRDAYAVFVAQATGWDVTNLACSGATIAHGLLGVQHAGSRTVPAQLDNPAVADATTLIISIGANDVGWSDLLRVCAISANCDNRAERAYFQQRLAGFSAEYLQLLTDLQTLPNHPRVLVNLYYNPFSDKADCLADDGITSDKQKSMVSALSALNDILSSGAKAAAFSVARPDFAGHGLCSSDPWVQGVDAPAPFHPTAAGGLAIALADVPALQRTGGNPR
jgi:lysophospholipase L1-like esterase